MILEQFAGEVSMKVSGDIEALIEGLGKLPNSMDGTCRWNNC